MAYSPLSELDDWHLVHPEQDIRGWKVLDTAGTTLGRVDELLVDTDSELVEMIRLDNGDEYAARDIEIGDNVIHVRGEATLTEATTEPVARTYRDTRIQRTEPVGTGTAARTTVAGTPLTTATSGTPLTTPLGYDNYAADFRTHYNTTYGTAGRGFDVYEPGYRYGYAAGLNDTYRNREYTDLEPELRRGYEREHGEGTWDRIKDAARHAFQRGRGHSH